MSEKDSSTMTINLGKVHCPDCKQKMPAVRVPENIQQLMWGGWSCPKCNCKMDRFGKAVKP